MRDFVNRNDLLNVTKAAYTETDGGVEASVNLFYKGAEHTVGAVGNGSLDAVSNAIKALIGKNYVLETYAQHALEGTTSARAVSYVSVVSEGRV